MCNGQWDNGDIYGLGHFKGSLFKGSQHTGPTAGALRKGHEVGSILEPLDPLFVRIELRSTIRTVQNDVPTRSQTTRQERNLEQLLFGNNFIVPPPNRQRHKRNVHPRRMIRHKHDWRLLLLLPSDCGGQCNVGSSLDNGMGRCEEKMNPSPKVGNRNGHPTIGIDFSANHLVHELTQYQGWPPPNGIENTPHAIEKSKEIQLQSRRPKHKTRTRIEGLIDRIGCGHGGCGSRHRVQWLASSCRRSRRTIR
mmetsp:Transcript_27006/g.49130  ORF Transcript_27006/g.49130 Transcript_27006/m.49130 type:complete len:251 (+) Transcript_27006:321-1073(+)